MKTSLFYLANICLLFVLGCKDDHLNEPCSGNCITITGKIATEHHSAVVAKGVKLKLSWGRPVISFVGGSHRNIAITTSDEKGNYEFKFTPTSKELLDGSYDIEFSKNGYFPDEVSFYNISHGDTIVHRDLHIAKKGIVKVKILDFPTNSSHDSINISTSYSNYLGSWYGTVKYNLHGQAISPNTFNVLEFTSEVAANQYTYFDILRIVNGQKQFERDSIFNNAGQETTYLYKY